MDEKPLVSQESIDFICQIASNLHGPLSIWRPMDSGHPYTTRRKFDYKEDQISH